MTSFYNITRQQCGRNIHDVIFTYIGTVQTCSNVFTAQSKHLSVNGWPSNKMQIKFKSGNLQGIGVTSRKSVSPHRCFQIMDFENYWKFSQGYFSRTEFLPFKIPLILVQDHFQLIKGDKYWTFTSGVLLFTNFQFAGFFLLSLITNIV